MANNVPLVPIGGIASSRGNLAAPGSLYKTLADESVARKKLLQDKQYRDEQLLLQKAQEERAVAKFAGEQEQAKALKALNLELTDMPTTKRQQKEQVDYKLSDAQKQDKIAAEAQLAGIYGGAEGDFAKLKQSYVDKLKAEGIDQPVAQGEQDIRQAPATLLGGGTVETKGLVFPWDKKAPAEVAITQADRNRAEAGMPADMRANVQRAYKGQDKAYQNFLDTRAKTMLQMDEARKPAPQAAIKDTTTVKQEDKILTDRADKLATTEFLAGFSQKYDVPYAALQEEITSGDKLNLKAEKVITKLEEFEDVKLTPAEMNKKRGDLIRRSNIPEATKKLLRDSYMPKEQDVGDALAVKRYQDEQSTLKAWRDSGVIPKGVRDMPAAKTWINRTNKGSGKGDDYSTLIGNLDTFEILGWDKGEAQSAIERAKKQGYNDYDIKKALQAGKQDNSIDAATFNRQLALSKKKEQK